MQVQEQLQTLGPAWISFQQCLIDCEIMLKKSKDKFKSSLLLQAEEFKKSVNALVEEFTLRGPFTSKTFVGEALATIKAFKSQIEVEMSEEKSLQRGLQIFKIEHQNSKALQLLEIDVNYLEQVNLFILTLTFFKGYQRSKSNTSAVFAFSHNILQQYGSLFDLLKMVMISKH